MHRLRIAQIGVGHRGPVCAKILSQLEKVELIAIIDPMHDAAKKIAEKCGTKWHANYDELSQEVDAVLINVPVSYRAKIASDFLNRNIAVLVDAPVASKGNQVEQLSRQVRELLPRSQAYFPVPRRTDDGYGTSYVCERMHC